MATSDFIILFLLTSFFGAIIGAYFGTIEYRIRNDEPLVTSKCYCPWCKHEISLWFQVPVISWLYLRSKCHYCRKRISVRYPLIEFGFIFFYAVTFTIFYKAPTYLILSWFFFITTMLLIRSNHHYRSMIKGLLIMFAYHFIYGLLLAVVLFALKS